MQFEKMNVINSSLNLVYPRKIKIKSLCQNAISPETVDSQTIKDRGFIPLKKKVFEEHYDKYKKRNGDFDFNG
ncbi:hypothetical protein [Caldifermentibacillus hisashii]|uniref:hypothetical protein n=1 Tax=Caldifermentibacillus hisashii TaxID=996558 RepID=UPI00342CBFF0